MYLIIVEVEKSSEKRGRKFESAYQVIGIKAKRQVPYVTSDQFVVDLLLCKVQLVTGTLLSRYNFVVVMSKRMLLCSYYYILY
jgi:hypothetical protein